MRTPLPNREWFISKTESVKLIQSSLGLNPESWSFPAGNMKSNGLHETDFFFYSNWIAHFTQNAMLLVIYFIQEVVYGLLPQNNPTFYNIMFIFRWLHAVTEIRSYTQKNDIENITSHFSMVCLTMPNPHVTKSQNRKSPTYAMVSRKIVSLFWHQKLVNRPHYILI